MSEGIVHDSFYNFLCSTANNLVGWYGCSVGNLLPPYSGLISPCSLRGVTVSKEQSSSHLQGGTYTI